MLEMDNEFEDDDIWFEGGDGSSMTDAVIIRGTKDTAKGVRAEKEFISSRYGHEGSDWYFDTQELFLVDSEAFDLITFWLADGSLEQIYFDITEFYGNI